VLKAVKTSFCVKKAMILRVLRTVIEELNTEIPRLVFFLAPTKPIQSCE
jgi:hypothetical protein